MREVMKNLLTSTSSRNRPRQIAAALAMGLLCGFVPANSGTFYVLLACAFFLPIHLPVALVTTLAVAICLPWLHSTLGEVGLRSLEHPYLTNAWMELDRYPLVPWLGLHNTVVNGGLLCGLALLLPVYVFTRPVAVWVIQEEKAVEYSVLAEAPVHVSGRLETSSTAGLLDIPPASATSTTECKSEMPLVSELEELLDECTSPNTSNRLPGDTEAVIERASRVAELVDDILATLEETAEQTGSMKVASTAELTDESRSHYRGVDFEVVSAVNEGEPVNPPTHAEENTAEELSRVESASKEANFDTVDPSEQQLASIASEECPNANSPVADEVSAIRTQAYEGDGMRIQVVRGAADRLTSIQGREMPLRTHIGSHGSNVPKDASSLQSEKLVTVHTHPEHRHSESLTMPRAESEHVARQEDALRHLLSHLRELKEKV